MPVVPGDRSCGISENMSNRRCSCGTVFCVIYNGESCALKVGQAIEKDTFQEEVKVMEQLAGAGGAPLVLATCPEKPAFVMTLCGTLSLDRFLRKKKKASTCVKVARLVAKALREVHAKGVVHCDLKSNNVLVDVDANGKPTGVHIIDFGLARPAGTLLKIMVPKGSAGEWYCPCFYMGKLVSLKCDMQGMADILSDIAKCNSAVADDLQELITNGRHANHKQRLSAKETLAKLKAISALKGRKVT
ncbi:raf homolog serine/threonine-protein kinase Raf-like [Penaeus indicus]|uniref:raf homolog serine/threonine-protein kinase Raf-like n=1 Tax=Penaeus indicus TaxID=29960 RepID=UPI00300D0FD6